ncbi:MAG: DNA-3-methyladenine glycosylase 2 family protein [Bacteroidetes bacterium]|nr:MAG: DNA-3-methyladenine glycosylase 2 family protein [Bacteroidota bacterium]
MTPEILNHLSRDSKLRSVIESTQVTFPETDGDVYARLIRAIIYQQLSGKAASTIYGRFIELFPDEYPDPGLLLSFDLPTLRSVGLSRQKSGYLQNVAEFFQQEGILEKDWSDMEDEAIIKYLTQIKGVGKWTVEMLLMFTLNRTDILPVDDLGIQQGMQLLFGFEAKGRELKEKMIELAEPWRPYRTFASLYLWRWKDGVV